ncbi:MAG: capsid cement protein, partial [Rhodobacterales bacterium]
MKNFIGVGNRVTLTATSAVTSGQPVLFASLFGIAENAAAIGDPLVLVLNGIFDLTK